MEKVTMWKTKDGEMFASAEEAQVHELVTEMCEQLERDGYNREFLFGLQHAVASLMEIGWTITPPPGPPVAEDNSR